MKTSEAFPSKYLKAADLGDRERTVTIEEISSEEMVQKDGERVRKTVLYFQRIKKGMVLNVVNMRVIEKAYGDEMDDWIGKEIILYAREVEAFGGMTEAIRVRMPQVGKSTAPAHVQQRPGFQSGLPEQKGRPTPRKPAVEHPPTPPAEAYTEANPPPNTGQNYDPDMNDTIPF